MSKKLKAEISKGNNVILLRLSVFIIISVFILSLSYYIYKEKYYTSVMKNINSELEAVSRLKLENIVQWRNERIRNLIVLQNPAFGSRVKKTLEFPGDEAVQKEMYDWLIRFDENYGYERSCIHDLEGNEAVKTDEAHTEMITREIDYNERLFEKKEVIFGEMYFDSLRNKEYIPVIAGMFDFYDGMKPLGFMLSRINPEDYLFPLLNSWPVPRKSAQSFLVKREADNIVLLNNCTENNNSALNMTFRISDFPEMPAVKAVSGSSGIVEGENYSGKDVIAFVSKVPGTKWFIISKIDSEEALTPARTAFNTIFLIAALVIFLFGTGMLFISRSQKYKYYKELAKKSAELAESEANLKITLSSIGDGVIATDREGRITMLNKTAQALTGWSIEDAKTRDIREVFRIINAHTRKEVLNPVEIVMKDGITVGLANHTILISKDGKEYQIADSAAPIVDEGGNIHGMILVFSDVTEKYEIQEKTAENERFLNSMISNLKGVVYRCKNDEAWTMTFLNKEFKELTGYSPEEFMENGSKKFNDIIFEHDRIKVKEAVEKALTDKRHFTVEYRIVHSSGEIIWVLEKGKGIFDNEGNLRFLEGFITDITLNKTAEIQIREKSDELERANKLMIGRELKMVELKKEINELLAELGRERKYTVND